MPASRPDLEAELARHGLRLRGRWTPTSADALAALPAGPVAVVWMVGQIGSECWPVFSRSRSMADGLPDPMDRWSQSIGDAMARRWGGRAVYPSDGPPYAPFQRWAARAEPLQASALQLQIHPRFGLWHAWRFALLLPDLAPDDLVAPAARAGAPSPDAGEGPQQATAAGAAAPASATHEKTPGRSQVFSHPLVCFSGVHAVQHKW